MNYAIAAAVAAAILAALAVVGLIVDVIKTDRRRRESDALASSLGRRTRQ